MEPKKGGGLPLHVNPTDPKVIASRDAARIRRLRLKLAELGQRRARGETGPKVSDERIDGMMAELQRRGGMPPSSEITRRVADELRARGLTKDSTSGDEITKAMDEVTRRAALGIQDGSK